MRKYAMHKQITNLDANDDDGTPVIVLDADIDAILFLRSGNVSITKSRNSNKAPTSFCSSCENEINWTNKNKNKINIFIKKKIEMSSSSHSHTLIWYGKMKTTEEIENKIAIYLCRIRKQIRRQSKFSQHHFKQFPKTYKQNKF